METEEKESERQEPATLTPENRTPEPFEKKCDPKDERHFSIQRKIAAGTLIAAFSATVYAGIAAWQLVEMRKAAAAAISAAQAAQNTLVLDQRAWIAPVSGNTRLLVSQTPRVDVIIENLGKTPALSVNQVLDWKELPVGTRIDINYDSHVQHVEAGTIYPGGKGQMFAKNDMPVTEDQISGLKSGKAILYYFGEVDYKDIFGNPHFTHFCNVLFPDLSGVRPCDVYNEAN